jgi:hypothetical protein
MRWALVTMTAAAGLLGCASAPPQVATVRVDELDTVVHPPLGWTVQRADDTNRYVQRVWVSPSGRTSYGVIRFTLPLPVSEEMALTGFLTRMRQSEGEAHLLSKKRDEAQDRLQFTAEGGRYRLDGIIVTRGFHGWVIYDGVLRNASPALDEVALAVQARENTRPEQQLEPGDVKKGSSRRE